MTPSRPQAGQSRDLNPGSKDPRGKLVPGDKSQDPGRSAGASSSRTVGLGSENDVRCSAAWQADLTDHFLLSQDPGPVVPAPGCTPARALPRAEQGLTGNVGDGQGCHSPPPLLTSELDPTESKTYAEPSMSRPCAEHTDRLVSTHQG